MPSRRNGYALDQVIGWMDRRRPAVHRGPPVGIPGITDHEKAARRVHLDPGGRRADWLVDRGDGLPRTGGGSGISFHHRRAAGEELRTEDQLSSLVRRRCPLPGGHDQCSRWRGAGDGHPAAIFRHGVEPPSLSLPTRHHRGRDLKQVERRRQLPPALGGTDLGRRVEEVGRVVLERPPADRSDERPVARVLDRVVPLRVLESGQDGPLVRGQPPLLWRLRREVASSLSRQQIACLAAEPSLPERREAGQDRPLRQVGLSGDAGTQQRSERAHLRGTLDSVLDQVRGPGLAEEGVPTELHRQQRRDHPQERPSPGQPEGPRRRDHAHCREEEAPSAPGQEWEDSPCRHRRRQHPGPVAGPCGQPPRLDPEGDGHARREEHPEPEPPGCVEIEIPHGEASDHRREGRRRAGGPQDVAGQPKEGERRRDGAEPGNADPGEAQEERDAPQVGARGHGQLQRPGQAGTHAGETGPVQGGELPRQPEELLVPHAHRRSSQVRDARQEQRQVHGQQTRQDYQGQPPRLPSIDLSGPDLPPKRHPHVQAHGRGPDDQPVGQVGGGDLAPGHGKRHRPSQSARPALGPDQPRGQRQGNRGPGERPGEREGEDQRGAGDGHRQDQPTRGGRGPGQAFAPKEREQAEPRQQRLEDDQPAERQPASQHRVEPHSREMHPAGLWVGGEGDSSHHVGVPHREVASRQGLAEEAMPGEPLRQHVHVLAA